MLLNKMTVRERKALFGLCTLMLHNAMANANAFVVPLAIRSCITREVLMLLQAEWIDGRKMRARNINVSPQDIAAAMTGTAAIKDNSAPQAEVRQEGPSAEAGLKTRLDSKPLMSAGETFTTSSGRKYKVVTEFNMALYMAGSATAKGLIISRAVRNGAIEKVAA